MSETTVGRITFGAIQETSIPSEKPQGKPVTFRDIPWAGEAPRRQGTTPLVAQGGQVVQGQYWWLIELFYADGTTRGLYWAGKQNHIVRSPRGIEVTYNKLKARRVPLGCGDLAADIAAALNELPRHNGDTWIAMQHVFS